MGIYWLFFIVKLKLFFLYSFLSEFAGVSQGREHVLDALPFLLPLFPSWALSIFTPHDHEGKGWEAAFELSNSLHTLLKNEMPHLESNFRS